MLKTHYSLTNLGLIISMKRTFFLLWLIFIMENLWM